MRQTPHSYDYMIWKVKENKYLVFLIRTNEFVFVNKEIARLLWSEEKQLADEEYAHKLSRLEDSSVKPKEAIKHPISLEYAMDRYGNKSIPYWMISSEDVEGEVFSTFMIGKLLEALTPVEQDILKNCLLKGQSIRTYALQIGMPKSTVSDCIKRIRKKCKKFF